MVSYAKLFEMLKERGMKIKDLVEISRVSSWTLYGMKRARALVRDGVLVKICIALSCLMDDIMEIFPTKEVQSG